MLIFHVDWLLYTVTAIGVHAVRVNGVKLIFERPTYYFIERPDFITEVINI